MAGSGNQFLKHREEAAANRVMLLREALGVVMLGLTGFILICLSSFHAEDPSFNHVGDDQISNLGGSAGAYLADALLQLLGLSSLWLPMLLGITGFHLIRNRPVGWEWDRLLAAPVLIAVTCLLNGILLPGKSGGWLPAGPGGVLGNVGSKTMLHSFGSGGSLILLCALLILCLMVVLRFSVLGTIQAMVAYWRRFQQGTVDLAAWGTGFFKDVNPLPEGMAIPDRSMPPAANPSHSFARWTDRLTWRSEESSQETDSPDPEFREPTWQRVPVPETTTDGRIEPDWDHASAPGLDDYDLDDESMEEETEREEAWPEILAQHLDELVPDEGEIPDQSRPITPVFPPEPVPLLPREKPDLASRLEPDLGVTSANDQFEPVTAPPPKHHPAGMTILPQATATTLAPATIAAPVMPPPEAKTKGLDAPLPPNPPIPEPPRAETNRTVQPASPPLPRPTIPGPERLLEPPVTIPPVTIPPVVIPPKEASAPPPEIQPVAIPPVPPAEVAWPLPAGNPSPSIWQPPPEPDMEYELPLPLLLVPRIAPVPIPFSEEDEEDEEEEISPLPPIELLAAPPLSTLPDAGYLQAKGELLEKKLADFAVKGKILLSHPGPVVTTFEFDPAPGLKASKVVGLADDLARSISSPSVRVVSNIPGKSVIGIEVPNERRQIVYLRSILESEQCRRGVSPLTVALGSDITGQPVVADLAKMPHLLVAGTTGSGKSVAVHAMICSILFRATPDQVMFLMVDPKMLELSVYQGIPHLLAPVVTEVRKAATLLKWAVHEMEERYRIMADMGVRNLGGFNAKIDACRASGEQPTRRVKTGFDPETGEILERDEPIPLEHKPLIVIIIDELADLMIQVGKDVEPAIARLAQMARAAGLHLILATQRPSVDVITGLIKANFPTRLSFQVSSRIDSRTILDTQGAEQLLGMGDGLYLPPGTSRLLRVHAPYVADNEVHKIVDYLRRTGQPRFNPQILNFRDDGDDEEGGSHEDEAHDEYYDLAVAQVIKARKVSTSMVQRHFKIGYNRAARIVERMAREGLVSEANTAGKREVLVPAAGG